jgi:hypothetical protein
MRQIMGFGMVLSFLALSAWGIVHEFKREKPPADAAAFTFATNRLESAAERLEQTHEYLGSYNGIDRDLFVGMDIAYASEDRYCLQIAREGAWYHLTGPNGVAMRGGCAASA